MNSVIVNDTVFEPLTIVNNEFFVGERKLQNNDVITTFTVWFYGERLNFVLFEGILYNHKYQIYITEDNMPEQIGTLFAVKE